MGEHVRLLLIRETRTQILLCESELVCFKIISLQYVFTLKKTGIQQELKCSAWGNSKWIIAHTILRSLRISNSFQQSHVNKLTWFLYNKLICLCCWSSSHGLDKMHFKAEACQLYFSHLQIYLSQEEQCELVIRLLCVQSFVFTLSKKFWRQSWNLKQPARP